MQGPLDNLLATIDNKQMLRRALWTICWRPFGQFAGDTDKKQMLRRSVGFSAGYDLEGPLDNLLATLDNKADVAEVGGPERTKVVTMDIAGEGFDCLQVFDLARSLETSWTRLDTANNLKLP